MRGEGIMSKLGALGSDAKKALGALGLAAALHEGTADAKKIRTLDDVKEAATITDLHKVKAALEQNVGAPAPTLRDAGKTPIDTDDEPAPEKPKLVASK